MGVISMDMANGKATFIIPHRRAENVKTKVYLDKAIESIFKQTDDNWKIILIDGNSPSMEVKEYLKELENSHPDRIQVIFEAENNGVGMGRNLGIKHAFEQHSPIILFNDADDFSHPKRLEVTRKVFIEEPKTGVVYSTFKVVDEDGNETPEEYLTPSILEILESHRNNPPQGKYAWIRIGTETGFTNLPSATSVRTELAYKYPFPKRVVSEDQHAWFRYSADEAGGFKYCPEIPSLYFIPRNTGSVHRAKIENYYQQKAETDTDGFMAALEIALVNGSIKADEKGDLLIRFYLKLAETMAKEKENDLALKLINEAKSISETKTQYYIETKRYKLS
jgi:glycosyltransferase involved in cell wall biosynthesis